MSDPSVSERRIRPIQDALASGSWKQALKECDKWFKKGERSDRFLVRSDVVCRNMARWISQALKAFVLANQPDKSQHDRGKQEALDLSKRYPPVTEPEAIYQLQDVFKSLSLTDAPNLWERALTTKKDDKDLFMRWINQAIAENDWRNAQKVWLGLNKMWWAGWHGAIR
jgi:hypothetical protein